MKKQKRIQAPLKAECAAPTGLKICLNGSPTKILLLTELCNFARAGDYKIGGILPMIAREFKATD
jgi:hypothetical protein